MDYKGEIKVPNYIIWVLFYVVVFVVGGCLFFVGEWDVKIEALFSGIVVSALVGVVQILSGLDLYRKNRRLEKTKIVDVIDKRKDEERYAALIKQSRKQVLVLGSTCSRFMKDFVEQSPIVSEAISRGVNFKLLIPDDMHLDQEDRSKVETVTLKIYGEMDQREKRYFVIRRFSSPPNHSLVAVDDIYIVGPIFRKMKRSEVTPSIVFREGAQVANAYKEYFHQLWGGS